MQVVLITQGSTVGHTDEVLTKLLKDIGYVVFKTEAFGGPSKYILSHPYPSWVPDAQELSALLNTEQNYMYQVEVFAEASMVTA